MISTLYSAVIGTSYEQDTNEIDVSAVVELDVLTVVAEVVERMDGKAQIPISVDDLSAGEYRSLVGEFVGSKKADQPLVLSGN